MAIYPCDFGSHRYGGPQQTAYPAFVSGAEADRTKLRLCPPHFEQLVVALEKFMSSAEEPSLFELCRSCDRPEPDGAAYVTLYATGAERRDLWASLHKTCGATWLESIRKRSREG